MLNIKNILLKIIKHSVFISVIVVTQLLVTAYNYLNFDQVESYHKQYNYFLH